MRGRQCSKTKLDGNRCKAMAELGKIFCVLHGDPNAAARLGSKGGRARSKMADFSSADVETSPPRTPAEIRDILALAIADVRSGRLGVKVGSTIAYLAAGLLRAMELSENQ